MKNRYIILLLIVFTGGILNAQSYEEVIQSVKSNNTGIEADTKLLKAEEYKSKTGLFPENPVFQYGYFPGNKSAIGSKETIDISQGIEFPTTYVNRKKLGKAEFEIGSLLVQDRMQQILWEAQSVYLELVYLNRYKDALQYRLEQAEKLYNATKTKFDMNDASIIDLSKTELLLAEFEAQIMSVSCELDVYNEKLKMLNKNSSLEVYSKEYPNLELKDYDAFLSELIEKHPILRSLEKESEFAQRQISLNRSLWLPDLSVGYSSETILGNSYKGFKFGLSIPLWKDLNKVRYSKAFAEYTEVKNIDQRMKIESWLAQKYKMAIMYKQNMEKYKSIFDSNNITELLDKSLNLGQISMIEYILEKTFFYEMYDKYLEYERGYYQTVAEMERFRL